MNVLVCYAKKAATAAFFLLWFGVASSANAADLITQRAWFEDKTGALTLEQVQEQRFMPYQGVLSKGIGKGVIWLRLTFDPTINTADTQLLSDRAVLRIRPVYLDNLTLYDPLHPTPKRSGDLTPVSQDEYQSLNLNFVIEKGVQARTLYLRLESTSTRMIEAQAFTLPKLQREDQGLLVFSGLYLGISALFLFWAITTWLMTKDRIVFAFIFSQAGALGIGLTVFGYARLWLSDTLGGPVISDLLTLSALASVITACWFYLRLISEFKAPNITLWIYRICIALEGLALGFFLGGDTRTAISFNWAVIMFLPVIGFLGLVFAKGWGDPEEGKRLLPRWVLLTYFGVNLLLLAAAGSAGFGVLTQASAFNVYAPLTNGIVAGALAVAVLQYRVNLAQKYQNELRLKLTISEQNAEKERESREERDRLLAMLGHELKTPLAAMRMLLGNTSPSAETVERIHKAITEMNSVIERSVQSGKIDSDAAQVQLTQFNLSEELHRFISECREPSAIQADFSDAGVLNSDFEFFRIIVLNLLDNACKYRAPGSKVRLSIRTNVPHEISGKHQSGVELMVENRVGVSGFPDPNKLFTKYYRSPMAHRQAGSGLGSYLVKGLIQKLGGTVRYEPSEELVRFVIWHPL